MARKLNSIFLGAHCTRKDTISMRIPNQASLAPLRCAGEPLRIRFFRSWHRPTGKSSLIASATQGTFLTRLPRVLSPTYIAPEDTPDGVGIVIYDTPPLESSRDEVITRCAQSDIVVLCFSSEQQLSVQRLQTTWMPTLRSAGLKVPVVIVGLRRDLQDQIPASQLPGGGNLELAVTPLMRGFPEIESCLECSALHLENVQEVFLFAVKVVLHPLGPLWDTESGLTPKCRAALLTVFRQCDRDNDGLLSDDELNAFQMRCFRAPLGPDEMQALKELIASRVPGALSLPPQRFVTQTGWLALHALSIEMGRNETAWAVLREFGYGNELALTEEALNIPPEYLSTAALNEPRDLSMVASTSGRGGGCLDQGPSGALEMTDEAVNFLSFKFDLFDKDNDGFVTDRDLELMFLTAPNPRPFDADPAWSAAKLQGLIPGHGLNKQGFHALWSYLALRAPSTFWAHLVYLGYPMELGVRHALRLCERRGPGRPSAGPCLHQGGTLRVGILGPRGTGKTTLLYALLGQTNESDVEFTVRGTRVTAVIKAVSCGSLRTLVLEELSAEDNLFVESLDTGTFGASNAPLASSGPPSSSSSIWGLADAFRSLLGGSNPRQKAQTVTSALAHRYDLLLVTFDGQSLASARAAICIAAACRGQAGKGPSVPPILLVGCKGDLGTPPLEVLQLISSGCLECALPPPQLVDVEDTKPRLAEHSPAALIQRILSSTLSDGVAQEMQ